MMGRVQRLATVGWSVVAAGAGLGFVARDLLGLPGLAVALAWVAGRVRRRARRRVGAGFPRSAPAAPPARLGWQADGVRFCPSNGG